MSYGIDFAPHLPPTLLWLLIVAAIIALAWMFMARARGSWARLLAVAVVLAALANPLIVREVRTPITDVVALVIDHSQSMGIHDRQQAADRAAAEIRRRLALDKTLEVRQVFVNTNPDSGTQLFSAVTNALADVPPKRVAGVIAITDGEVHDVPANGKSPTPAPMHALIVGERDERDRKLTILNASRFAIVGQDANIELKVDDFGTSGGGTAEVDVRIDGIDAGTRVVEIGKPAVIKVPVKHGGENVIELEAMAGPAELTLQNNRSVITVSGVRDRLRVLLVSGEPHAGERVWRNLLKSDPSVDLVHFTILRPPEKQDATPLTELSLIAFPTHELFAVRLDSFDLVIFDRYRERGILPPAYFANLVRYVQKGGALLVSSGPEFVGDQSIYHTPLAAVLPAQPTGQVVAEGFKPIVTPEGLAHPVTHGLQGENADGKPPTWGRWFRLIGATRNSGETLMSGPNDLPLLVLDHVQQGRVAELLSDHVWLWARGFEGGGPQVELLRRLAHWLMKEPELEEERLTASVVNGDLVIERRTMAAMPAPVMVTPPSGKQKNVTLDKMEPGLWRGIVKADELGLYRLTDGKLSAVAAAGPLNPLEVSDMRATASILEAPTRASGGSVRWLSDGVPSIRRIEEGDTSSGSDWIGLRQNAYRVAAVEQQPLLPAWLALLLLLGTLLLAWRVEGR